MRQLGHSALLIAARMGSAVLVSQLLKTGASLDLQDEVVNRKLCK